MESMLHIEATEDVGYKYIEYPSLSNHELIEGLRCWDKVIVNYIYYNYYPVIEEYVFQNKGNEEDMKDLFHDALLILNKKLNEQTLELRKDFYCYFFGVCRRIWLNNLKEKSYHVHNDNYDYFQDKEVVKDYEPCIYDTDNVEKEKLLRYHLNKLDKESQQIIALRFANVPYKQIADEMKLGSEQKARSKKHYCIGLLTKSIKSDRRFKELMEK